MNPTPAPPPPPIAHRLHVRLGRVEASAALDPVARLLQRLAAGPGRGRARSLLTGTWFGHGLHPVLTDFAEGAWMAGSFLDLFGPPRSEAAARRLVGFGLACAVPTAVTGLAEWADTDGGERRVGALHAVGSSTAMALYACSYLARRRGRQATAVALGTVGGLVAIADGYVGGHLTLALGVGVRRTAFDPLPDRWTRVDPVGDLRSGRPVPARVGATEIVVVRAAGQLYALVNRCTYRGGRLDASAVDGDVIVCPSHGCEYRLSDGAVRRGPASMPLPTLEARLSDGGAVEVRGR